MVVADTALTAQIESLGVRIRELSRATRRSLPGEDSIRLAKVPQIAAPFAPPNGVLGFQAANLEDLNATSRCEGTVSNGFGTTIYIKFADPRTVRKLSPLVVYVAAVDPVRHQPTVVFLQQYEAMPETVLPILVSRSWPGTYELDYGYYRLDEPRKPFPNFYHKSCDISPAPSGTLPGEK
jgi:hypothetical protein